MARHSDGNNKHPTTGRQSSATFLLYLADCAEGGHTAFYDSSKPGAPELCRQKIARIVWMGGGAIRW